MTHQVVVTKAALQDMEEAAIWYENQTSGIGHKFLSVVNAGFEIISKHPDRYPYADSEKRRRKYLLPSPFRSYLIIYTIDENTVTVLAVFHTSRNPSIWQSRD
ncbi:MAG: type II toxin-antitoxin system RelE/ParE family toxin [Bacteroidota bacterium]